MESGRQGDVEKGIGSNAVNLCENIFISFTIHYSQLSTERPTCLWRIHN